MGWKCCKCGMAFLPVDASRTTTNDTTCADPKAISLGGVEGRAQRIVVCGQIIVSFARLGEPKKDKGGAIALGFYLSSLGKDGNTSGS